MFCSKCGADIPAGSGFCPQCGTPASAPPQPSYAPPAPQPESPPPFIPFAEYTPPPVPKKRSHLKAIIISAAGVIVLAGCIILALILIYNAKAEKYNDAVAAMSTDLQYAKEEFTALGGFIDSTAKAQQCQNMMDYASAKALMSSGKYEDAQAAFKALGSYKDSAQLADYCEAVALRDAGKTEEAVTAFTALGSFMDSATQAKECQNKLDYADAKALFDNGNFEIAKTVFTKLGDYEDSKNMVKSCQNAISYKQADQLYTEGKYYDAMVIFGGLGSYSDSAQRAQQCVQATPKTGQLYRNPAYSKKSVPLKIIAPSDGYLTYIKIYNGNDLVSTVFLNPGTKITIKLPAGSYEFREAGGYAWYGETDMFGDGGYYVRMIFDSGSTTWRLKSHWRYWVNLRVSGEGNISTDDMNRNNF